MADTKIDLGTSNNLLVELPDDAGSTYFAVTDSSGNILTKTVSNGVTVIYSPSSDQTAYGDIASVTVDANATGFGALLYIASDFHYEEADASASSTMPGVALALETGTGTKKVLLRGVIRNDAWNWSAGKIYASETTGALTQTVPSTSGSIVQVVGIALSADIMLFNPSLDTITVA